jgi:hypothetical protein
LVFGRQHLEGGRAGVERIELVNQMHALQLPPEMCGQAAPDAPVIRLLDQFPELQRRLAALGLHNRSWRVSAFSASLVEGASKDGSGTRTLRCYGYFFVKSVPLLVDILC